MSILTLGFSRIVQSAHNSWLEESVCLVVKNIGKPCAGKPQARFDEGGQGEICSLLYLGFFQQQSNRQHRRRVESLRHGLRLGHHR